MVLQNLENYHVIRFMLRKTSLGACGRERKIGSRVKMRRLVRCWGLELR